MNMIIDDPRRRSIPTFLSYGFRPFFLAAGLWSAMAVALWIALFADGRALPSRFDPLGWHVHEMLFGFVMAAISGFLLTAIPNWTRRPPVAGGLLALLAGLWLLGRIACLVSALVPAPLALAADLSFPVALVTVVAREIVAGRNWRNLVVLGPLSVLGLANLLMHLETLGWHLPAGLGWRLGLAAVIVLISVVGGRIVPNFTRNWLVRRPGVKPPAPHDWVDRGALGLLPPALLGWALLPDFAPVGGLLLAAAGLHLWRVLRWRGVATAAEPLLLVLHIGYGWLVLGVALLGLSMIVDVVPASAAIHALTVGAIGTMILAVMTRATRGHSGRDLSADRVTSAIFALVTLAAISRVAAAFAPDWIMALLGLSAGLWITAFGLFVLAYARMLLLPVPRDLA